MEYSENILTTIESCYKMMTREIVKAKLPDKNYPESQNLREETCSSPYTCFSTEMPGQDVLAGAKYHILSATLKGQ